MLFRRGRGVFSSFTRDLEGLDGFRCGLEGFRGF